jgi:hypothetical protein
MLVISASGIFQKSSSGHAGTDADAVNEQDIWNISWTWINAFYPTLQDDIGAFPKATELTVYQESEVAVNKT